MKGIKNFIILGMSESDKKKEGKIKRKRGEGFQHSYGRSLVNIKMRGIYNNRA